MSEPEIDIDEKNGVYLFEIESVRDGYLVYSTEDYTVVDDVTVNGNYVGTSETFEIESDRYNIRDGVLRLIFTDKKS